MDSQCSKILTTLILGEGSAHFNELLKRLKKNKMEISRPTLSLHLKHLIAEGYISRSDDKTSQYVTYSLTLDKIDGVKNIGQRVKRIKNSWRETEKEFLSLPIEEQLEELIFFLIHLKMEEIKAQIDYTLDPESLDKQVTLSFLKSPVLHLAENWMINEAIKDVSYKKLLLEKINNWILKIEGSK
jgi:DNA-binding HxlR family transcriptional regulator